MSDQPIVANPPVAGPGDRVILCVIEQEGFELYDKIVQLKMSAEDGKLRFTDCVNTNSRIWCFSNG